MQIRIPDNHVCFITALHAVAKQYGYSYSYPWVAGASGHAFITFFNGKASGPLVFPRDETIFPLAENMGLKFVNTASLDEIKEALENEQLLIFMHYDYQVITGHDNENFFLQPSENTKVFPARLPINIWEENQWHYSKNTFIVEETQPASPKKQVTEALNQAVEFTVGSIAEQHDRLGLKAYDDWIDAINEGLAGKDNWSHTFTSQVYSNCRQLASDFMVEAKPLFDSSMHTKIDEIVVIYKEISAALSAIAGKETKTSILPSLEKANQKEEVAMSKILDLVRKNSK